MKKIDELGIIDVDISKLSTFNGYQIEFTAENQRFQFLIGNREKPIPLNIIHKFKEKEPCLCCDKIIYQYPIGQQPCSYFQKQSFGLLFYFQSNYAEKFQI